MQIYPIQLADEQGNVLVDEKGNSLLADASEYPQWTDESTSHPTIRTEI